MMNTNTGARGIYVTRRPSLLGDYQPSCDPGNVIVDLYGDGSVVECLPRGSEVDFVAAGGRVVGYAGSNRSESTNPTAQPPMTQGAGPAPTSPSIISQLEHTTGLSGSSLAIGMVVLLMLTRKK